MTRFLLQEIPSGRIVHPSLRLSSVGSMTQLSGPGSLECSIPWADHIEQSLPTLRKWHYAIWAVEGGNVLGGGVVSEVSSDNDQIDLDCTGPTVVIRDTPWLGEDFAGIQVDPLDMVRKVFDHAQSFPNGDLGIQVDSTRSPVRVGEEERDVEFTTSDGEEVSFTSGPFRLAWWSTDDMGKVLDDLAKDTPFDYMERTSFDKRTGFSHRLELGYPKIGARKPSVQAVIGVNAAQPPPLDEADYFSGALFVGAGEGAKAAHGIDEDRNASGLRRIANVSDKRVTSNRAAVNRARKLISTSRRLEFDQITLADHALSPFGEVRPGDIILVKGDTGVERLNDFVRVLQVSLDYEARTMSLKVEAE